MATLIDSAEFAANEIYEIQQTDRVEGAAVGASFGGAGISNQPHQQLANRTAFLKQRQDTNIANIGVLLGFMAEFTGTLHPNGNSIVRIPFVDSSRGAIVLIVQTGLIIYNTSVVDTPYYLQWPTPFPNACVMAFATALRDPARLANDGNDWNIQFVAGSGSATRGTFMMDDFGSGTATPYGFNWCAIGF